MKDSKLIIYFLGLVAGSIFAMPFCLQNSNGLNCQYETSAECEEARSGHDLCLRNPHTLDSKEEDVLRLPGFGDKLYFGPILYKYSLEVCSEEERNVDQPLRCEPDPTP